MIVHRPHAPSPLKEWKFLLLSVQPRDPNEIGFNQAPRRERSNRHIPIFFKRRAALTESSSLVGYIKIHPIPSLLQSFFKHVIFVGSNCANTGDDVIQTLRLLNNIDNSIVHAGAGISFL